MVQVLNFSESLRFGKYVDVCGTGVNRGTTIASLPSTQGAFETVCCLSAKGSSLEFFVAALDAQTSLFKSMPQAHLDVKYAYSF